MIHHQNWSKTRKTLLFLTQHRLSLGNLLLEKPRFGLKEEREALQLWEQKGNQIKVGKIFLSLMFVPSLWGQSSCHILTLFGNGFHCYRCLVSSNIMSNPMVCRILMCRRSSYFSHWKTWFIFLILLMCRAYAYYIFCYIRSFDVLILYLVLMIDCIHHESILALLKGNVFYHVIDHLWQLECFECFINNEITKQKFCHL